MANITPDAWSLEVVVDQERERILERRLMEYNRVHAPLWEKNHDGRLAPAPLHIYAHDAERSLIGGLIGRTNAIPAWLEVSVLWVHEDRRGSGVGRALMERAEEEARRRGCLYARLASSAHQAPAFYEKLGYNLYGRLEDCPPGDSVYYFRKNLF